MERKCRGGHAPYVETPKNHEVRGPRAKFVAQYTYQGIFPDGCKAPETYRYDLTVDGVWIDSIEFSPHTQNQQRRFWVLKEIAEAMNERSKED